jgi:DNA-binding NtrC family response regulator
MKKKPLAHYLDLMKSAQDKQEWIKGKKYGESALKQLNKLSYSPLEEYLLHCRLGHTYGQLAEYSRSLDVYYKAYLIATKNHFSPAYIAYTSGQIGHNFLNIQNINQAIVQFRKVEEYYQKYGDTTFPMDKQIYLYTLVELGHCYLYKNKLNAVKEIIEQKLSIHQSFLLKGVVAQAYYHLKGEYLMRLKEYDQSSQAFQECIKFSEHYGFPRTVFETKIHLAEIEILKGRPNIAIQILQIILKDSQRVGLNRIFCEAGLLLSKCYGFTNMPDKVSAIEKRIKHYLKKIDILWFYETIRQFEQLYHQLQSIYKKTETTSIPVVLINTLKQRDESLTYKNSIIGKSNPMREIFNLIEKIAPTDLPVLIQGETGTGKELVAWAIHHNSLRGGKEWLALNCGAIPETLLENTLFGHIKGAFTDAKEDRRGYIELTSDGTLFMDEISDMSFGMQQKLLRALDEKQVWRLGSEKPTPVNTRFIFASNQNIEELVTGKRFREDLYYRINTIVITLPPLRDRKEDIPLLLNHFLRKYGRVETLRYSQGDTCHSEGVPIKSGRPKNLVEITPSALNLLVNYNWPGNVRELENEIKRICALYPNTKIITEEMLSQYLYQAGSKNIRNYKPKTSLSLEMGLNLKELKKLAEKDIIIDALKKCNGNITQTARHLGCLRQHLQKKIKVLKIETSINFVTEK